MTRTSTALLLTLALAATPVFAANGISKVNGAIHAQSGQSYGDLSTVNGSITVGEKATTSSLETVNGSIRLERDVTVNGSVETVNGAIFIDRGGKVKKGVETVNGSIGLVGTHVGDDVETVRGSITVGVDSHVAGGLRVEKSTGFFNTDSKKPPRIIIGPNAVVEGPLVFERPVVLYVHRTAKIGPVTGATAQSFDGDTAPKE